jgi:hypothetical protein
MTDRPIGGIVVARYGVRTGTPSRADREEEITEMGSIEGDIRGRASVNDVNEGLRVRLSGRALPDPSPAAAELRRLVLQRLDPGFLSLDEQTSE